MMKTFFLSLCLLGVFISLSAAPWPASLELESVRQYSPAASSQEWSTWTELHSELTGRPLMAWGQPFPVAHLDRDELLTLIRARAGTQSEFRPWIERQIGKLTRFTYREFWNGLPVVSGRADLTLNERSELMRWSVRAHDMLPVSGSFSYDDATCASQLEPARLGMYNSIESVERVFYPDWSEQLLIPAYWIYLAGTAPHERWVGIVDATSGAVLLEWPGIASDQLSGTVLGPYWPEYLQFPTATGIHAHETIYIDSNTVFTNEVGEFSAEAGTAARVSARLRGPYVFVQNEDAPAGDLVVNVQAPYSPLSLNWTAAHASDPELNLYFHTTFIHDWYKLLDPNNDALDYPLPAVANVGSGYDNAYWNGFGTYYGSGSIYENFAMFSDVIYHEYTHGVTDGIYPNNMLPYIGQPGAMNEAWSDYFACTINEDPLMAERMLGNNPHSWFRNLEDDMVFPQDWRGEVHADSPFISAPLWYIRQLMGAAFADSLAHFARYGLAETFLDYLIACLETDDDDGNLANGTPHSTIIYEGFGAHGIGPGNDPAFSISQVLSVADGSNGSVGDGDRFTEHGETIALTFDLTNGAILFPPPAENISVTVTTSDENVTLQNAIINIQSLGAGMSQSVGPVLIQLNPAAADRWLSLNIHVSCSNSSVTLDYPLEFAVGYPRVLIVADDATSDVERFVTAAIRAQNRIFEKVDLEGGADLPTSLLPDHGLLIWLSGNEHNNILTASDLTLLTNYMNAGNKIVLSGQDIVDDLSESDFFQNQLRVTLVSDSNVSNSVTAEAAPLPADDWYLITGARGASNQRRPSAFAATGTSRVIAHYGRGETGPGAVVEFGNGHGLLFGFGIEAVSGMAPGSATLDNLLTSVYEWAGGLLPLEKKPQAVPSQLAITSTYPNPFNSSTTIRYSLPPSQSGELRIFDISGRTVATLRAQTGSSEIVWSPAVATGLYFAQLVTADHQTPPSKLLLLR